VYDLETSRICTPYIYDISHLRIKEDVVMQRIIDRLTEAGRQYGMEMKVKKTKAMRASNKPSQV
jgi:hypothetical protein